MKFSKIYNSKIILTDSVKLLEKNNVTTDKDIILTFLGEDNYQKNIFNFYNQIDQELHEKYNILSKDISESFHESLNISLALKKNITRIFYGQIGFYLHFDLIEKLIKNKNTLNIYTEDKKIFDFFSIIKKFENLNIFYKKKKDSDILKYFKISKIDLLRIYSLSEIIFYIKKKLFFKFKNLNKLKKIVFIHLSTESNFLSLDYFLNKRWQTKLLEINLKKSEILCSKNYQEFNQILDCCHSFIKLHFKDNKYFKEHLDNEFKTFFEKYISYYDNVSKIFKNNNSKIFFLTKIIRGPLITSLYDYGKRNKKKFFWIAHQHGHGVEITDIHNKSLITKEETLADLFFVYSTIGKKRREKNKFINKNIRISTIGYQNNSYKFKRIPIYDIIYVSNLNQEISDHEINMSALNNFEKIKFEERLIKEVFSQVNYKILFKEYPGSKTTNIKNDYFSNLINRYENITYFNKWLNAENIYDKTSIIITSLPSSGLAGAIEAKKPLIFIDIKKIMPLRKDLIETFKKKYFYLDFNENIFSDLKKLLSNNMNEIQAMWENKNKFHNSSFEDQYINILPKYKILNNLKKELEKFAV